MKPADELTILLTGATSGIGLETGRALVRRGARVILHGRDAARLEQVREEFSGQQSGALLDVVCADLGSMEQIRRMAGEVRERYEVIDMLINNAGAGGLPGTHTRQESTDGHELCLAINCLAPFALTGLLLEPVTAGGGRIVNVTSAAQAPLELDNLMLERDYEGTQAYKRSKLALVMFTFDLARRLEGTGATVHCVHPGSLLDTRMVREAFGAGRQPVEVGVRSLLHVALSDELDGSTGRYFDETSEGRAHEQAYDEAVRRRLWEAAEELTGVRYSAVR